MYEAVGWWETEDPRTLYTTATGKFHGQERQDDVCSTQGVNDVSLRQHGNPSARWGKVPGTGRVSGARQWSE